MAGELQGDYGALFSNVGDTGTCLYNKGNDSLKMGTFFIVDYNKIS